jgi:uncharacterized membrane protein
MKIFFASLIALASSPVAHAEKFTCGFTEPFYTVTYDTGSQKLVSRDDVMRKSTTFRNVAFQIVAPGEFRLSDQRGRELLRLKLTMEGSDGMSNVIYPFEASTEVLLGGANNGVGGCESTLLKNREGEH